MNKILFGLITFTILSMCLANVSAELTTTADKIEYKITNITMNAKLEVSNDVLGTKETLTNFIIIPPKTYGAINLNPQDGDYYTYTITSPDAIKFDGEYYIIDKPKINRLKLMFGDICDLKYDEKTILQLIIDGLFKGDWENYIIFDPKCEYKQIDKNTLTIRFLGNVIDGKTTIDPFTDAQCTSGTLASHCFLNGSYILSANEVVNAYNFTIQDRGNLSNNAGSIAVKLNITNRFIIESGGRIDLYTPNANGPKNVGNLTIFANNISLYTNSKINMAGGVHTAASSTRGGWGGKLNISTNEFYNLGNITIDGGDGTTGYGSGGHAGSFYLNSTNSPYLAGYISGRGGFASASYCSGYGGYRGNGGLFVFNKPSLNITFNGTIDLNKGEFGACGDGVWLNSTIIVDNILADTGSDVRVQATINASKDLIISGRFGGDSSNNSYNRAPPGGNLDIYCNVLNITSTGFLTSKGGDTTAQQTNIYGGLGGNINITTNNLYLTGRIRIDGGTGLVGWGFGGYGGRLWLNTNNSIDTTGYISANGGNAVSTQCSADYGGLRGWGGNVTINSPNNLTLNGIINLTRGQTGGCNDGQAGNLETNIADTLSLNGSTYLNGRGVSPYLHGSVYLNARDINIFNANNVLPRGTINATNSFNLNQTLGLDLGHWNIYATNFIMQDKANIIFGYTLTKETTIILTGNLTMTNGRNITGVGLASATIPIKGSNLTIIADIINISDNSIINLNGGSITATANVKGGNGGIINITSNKFYNYGNITFNGGNTATGASTNGMGGNAGVLQINSDNNFLNGYIYGLGGTGRPNYCLSGTSGDRGNGGTLIIDNNSITTFDGIVDLNIGSTGMCELANWSNSLINSNIVYINSGSNINMQGLINTTNLSIGGILSSNGIAYTLNATNAGYLNISSSIINLTGEIRTNGGNLTASYQGYGGKGGDINIIVNDFYANGDINFNGGNSLGGNNDGNGGSAGSLYIETTNNLITNNNITGYGGIGRAVCVVGASGYRGNGGNIYINGLKNITLNSFINISIGSLGACNNGVAGNITIVSPDTLNLTKNISCIGNQTSNNGVIRLTYTSDLFLMGTTMTSNPLITLNDTYGILSYTSGINNYSLIDYSESIFFNYNNVSVISTGAINIGLNKSADITFYNITDLDLTAYAPYRNYERCNAPRCNILQNVNSTQPTFRFNVSGFTDYSIGLGDLNCWFKTNHILTIPNGCTYIVSGSDSI